MEEVEIIELRNDHILKIRQDDIYSTDYINGDCCFLVYDHRDFTVEVDGFKPRDIYEYLTYPEKPIEEAYLDPDDYQEAVDDWDYHKPQDFSDYFIYVVYAYIHSGVSLSLSHNGDRWDTSSTGYILVDKNEIPEKENAYLAAQSVLKDWNNYLEGNVFWFELLKETTCEHCGHSEEEYVDSCGGFIGDDIYSCGIFDYIDGDLIPQEIKNKLK